MDDVKLLPCPFCGNDGTGPIEEALQICFFEHSGRGHTWSIQCDNCTATMGYSDSEEDAIAAWNTRTPASSGRTEGLREAAEMFHQEQVIVWVQDIVEGLGFADVLKIDSYDDNIAAHEMIEVGLMRIRDAILARAAEIEGKADE